MCSLQPTNDPVKDSNQPDLLSQPCIKCKQQSATINIRFAVYCDCCFLEQTFHKFRVTVGKSRRRNDREHILLFLDMSGGQRQAASLVLLGLVLEVIGEESNRVNQYSVCCFEDPLGDLSEKCSKYGISFYSLQTPFTTTAITTATQDQHDNVKMKSVAELYSKISADKLFKPETCNDMAVIVFKHMIKGNGEVVPWELQSVKRQFGMNIVRPLREHHNLEIIEYNRLKGNIVNAAIESTKLNTINDLTESFFSTLDRDYSATVSTVTKTAGKVSSHWCDHQDDYHECQECGCPTRNEHYCHGCIINQNELLLNQK